MAMCGGGIMKGGSGGGGIIMAAAAAGGRRVGGWGASLPPGRLRRRSASTAIISNGDIWSSLPAPQEEAGEEPLPVEVLDDLPPDALAEREEVPCDMNEVTGVSTSLVVMKGAASCPRPRGGDSTRLVVGCVQSAVR